MSTRLFWVLCMGVVFANAAIFRRRAARYSMGDSQMLAEARGIVNVFVVCAGGLIVLQAVGDGLGWSGRLRIGGSSDSVTPYDIVILAIAVAMLGKGTVWVFGQGGADLLVKHRDMFDQFPRSATGVRILWSTIVVAMISGCLATLVGMVGRH